MLLGRYSLIALTFCLLQTAAVHVAAYQYDGPSGIAWEGVQPTWTPPPQPPIPGPGWLADDPAQLVNPYDGTAIVAPADGWVSSYPFKYAPQGHRPSPTPDFESCLLSPEQSDACYLTTPPTYFGTFYFEVIGMTRRSNLESTDLVFDGANNPLFNSRSLALDTEASVRGGFICSHPNGIDWMVEYFGVHEYEDAATVAAAGGVQALVFGQTTPAATQVIVQYESRLDSVDFSLRARQTRRVAPIVGIRYLRIDEEFNVRQETATGTGLLSQTINQLFGVQFGFQGLIFEHGPWRMETTLKGGPFYNDIDVTVTPDPTVAGTTTKSVDHSMVTLMGDARIGMVCRLGRRMNVRFGYNALWFGHVAVAPNQNNNISFATNLEAVDLNDVLYQGGYVGFDLSW